MEIKEIVANIKRPYLTPFVIFTILLSLFFDAIMFFNSKLYDKLPLYLVVFLIFAIVVSILLYLQEKSEKVKVEKKNVIWYMTLNVITGYSMPLFNAIIYCFYLCCWCSSKRYRCVLLLVRSSFDVIYFLVRFIFIL